MLELHFICYRSVAQQIRYLKPPPRYCHKEVFRAFIFCECMSKCGEDVHNATNKLCTVLMSSTFQLLSVKSIDTVMHELTAHSPAFVKCKPQNKSLSGKVINSLLMSDGSQHENYQSGIFF